MTDNLFKYISKSDNIKLADLSKKDIDDLLYLISCTPIEYQNVLNFSDKYQFGMEIEFEKASFDEIKYDLLNTFEDALYITNKLDKEYETWSIEQEADTQSILDNKICGGEINTPIVNNTLEYWQELKKVCEILKNHKAVFENQAGFHIHLNKQILKPKLSRWLKLLKTWIIFEDLFVKLYCGERHHLRFNAQNCAKSISQELYNEIFLDRKKYKTIKQIQTRLKKINDIRCEDIAFYTPNVCNQTFELRACNGTDNEIIMQQYLNIFVRTILMVNNSNSDKFIENLFDEYENNCLEITLKTIYQLYDKMFDTIEDKAAALRLYYKDIKNSPLTTKQF